jgi:hypothetical protein
MGGGAPACPPPDSPVERLGGGNHAATAGVATGNFSLTLANRRAQPTRIRLGPGRT